MALPATLLEGKYEILDKIRDGGMGSIYRVRHRLLDQIRVVKVMKPHVVSDPDLRRRFAEEARTVTRLKHPNVCTVHDFALDEDGTAYLVMEFIEGVNLADLLRSRGCPTLPMTLEMVHQALLALGYLHRRSVVHRDVSPDNLMLTHDEEGRPLVKLIDLGIAKATNTSIDATATGVFLGKLKYASPEQFGSLPRGTTIDGRSDVYGVGVLLYELLTGRLPFEGDSPVELFKAHLFAAPIPFSESDPDGKIPEDVRAAVLKALEKKREDRYASAEEFARAIQTLKHKYERPEDLEETRGILRSIRPSDPVAKDGVTPSAQSRLDLQFGGRTPLPLTSGPTVVPRALPPRAERTVPLPKKGRFRTPAVLAAAAVAAVVGVLLWRRGSAPETERVAAAAPVVTADVVEPVRGAPATPAPPAAVAAEPTAEPSPEPTSPREPEPTEPPPPTRAPRVVPTAPPRRAPTVARVLVAVPTAAATRPQVIPSAVAPTPVPERPVEVAAVAPRYEREAGAPAAPAPPARPPALTDQDRIRETVARYERAQSTLDAALYAQVFPSVDRTRIARAFESFRSQTVQFEVRRIELDPGGSSAVVHGFEKRVAVPRAGSEQRIDAPRTLRLQKRGETWVITAIE